MKNKLLPFYSLAFSAGLLLSAASASAENVFTSSMSKAGNAVASATKATGNVAVKTAKVITPDSFFIEGSMLEIGSDSQIYGTQNNEPYAIETVNNSASGAFRAGIGYDIASDKELRFSYFRLKADDRNSTQEAGDAFYGNNNCCDINYESASAEFEHEINSIDIQIAKTKVVSNDLDLQISGGLKYASYQRNVNAIYYDGGFSDSGDTTSTKSSFKGFGPEIGIEADYKIAGGFSVYGGANAALMAGNLSVNRNSITGGDDSGSFKNKDSNVVPILAGDFGLKWSKTNIVGNNSLAIKIGYHIETWQSAVVDAYYPNDTSSVTNIDYKDLTLSGAYVRTTFSF